MCSKSKVKSNDKVSEEQVKEVKEWGLRDFAYPMKKQTKGYYVVLKVSAEPGSLDEFNRLAKLDSNVIRFLITVDQQ